MKERWPDFYIVGAPRCGTSFLWKALLQRPDIFMSRPKEPLYFCADLDRHTPVDNRDFIRDKVAYLALFRDAPPDATVGEACVFNLLSEVAAKRIHEVRPDARIIICLREPIAQMISFHGIRMAEGSEDLSLVEALGAESDRLAGKRLPQNPSMVPAYSYRRLATFAPQVQRYLDLFPRAQILICYQDELKDPHSWLASVLEFLGASTDDIEPPGMVALHWETRSPVVARLIRSRRVIDMAKATVPKRWHPAGSRLAESIRRSNRRVAPARPPDPQLLASLRDELSPSVTRLGELLGEDLQARWYGG